MDSKTTEIIKEIVKKLNDPILLFTVSFGFILVGLGIHDLQIVSTLINPLVIIFIVGLTGAIFLRLKTPTIMAMREQELIKDKPSKRQTVSSPENKADILKIPGIYFMQNRKWLDNDLKKSLIDTSSQIDMLGRNFNVTWFEIPEIVSVFEHLLSRSRSEYSLRILLPAPESLALKAHLADREALGNQVGMTGQGARSLARYNQTKLFLQNWNRKYSQEIVKYLPHEIIRFGLIRFDNIMIITHYLATDRGSDSPTTVIHRDAISHDVHILFERYLTDYNMLWNHRAVSIDKPNSNC